MVKVSITQHKNSTSYDIKDVQMIDIPDLWHKCRFSPQTLRQFSSVPAVPLVQKKEDASSKCPFCSHETVRLNGLSSYSYEEDYSQVNK